MGSVGRGENRAIFKLQEIGSEFRETMVKTHRFQQDRCKSQGEFVMIRKIKRVRWWREEVKAAKGCGEGECGGGECKSSSTCREGKWVRREGCSDDCRGEGFFAEEKKIRQPSGVEKKRR
ncbi:hypothetical protein OIU78_002581 [Salix suchowensis]|nr:hypothetical protein OIU78_002581 [Salix suchowensis]